MFQSAFIGLDVHAQTVVACALNTATGEVSRTKMSSEPEVVLDWIQKFPTDSQTVYEAGPTGYPLARHLREHGVDCVIAAPSKLLRAPGDHVKTDKRDAMGLAKILSLGEVAEVRIPTMEQEALRDLSRTRLQAQKTLKLAKQRLNALLLRQGVAYPDTKWTLKHMAWLHQQHFGQAGTEFSYQADVELVELLAAHLNRLDQRIKEIAPACEYARVIDALMCMRGIALTTGFGLAVEVGDWTRFTGSSIGSYLGLVPSEHSSGQKRAQGSITKAGNTYARLLLVEASWHQKPTFDRPGLRLQRQFDLVDSTTRITALKGNHRLADRWAGFEKRGKLRTKANTAIARELAGWRWALAAPLQEASKQVPAFSKENLMAA
ncbi:IS110 family transposase [Glutamicibacter ardleyensis]|uniref:IS110 family transposase n=1 Tax=Glutamicibacter ardleyensis TaxID=225894 RepID=UPI003FD0E682